MTEAFELNNDPPADKKPTFDSNTGDQRVLFSGLECLPGQQDLFETDGQPDELEE